MSLRVSFHTLGCKLNFAESSTFARYFESNGGFERVEPSDEAEICIINSCSVTEHSDKKCRNLIRKLHRRSPSAIIAVTGCYAQLKPEEIAKIEGVDIVLSNNDKGRMYDEVMALVNRRSGSQQGATESPLVTSCTTAELTSFFSAFSTGDRTRAFLKVQDGCDYKCSYCTIHYARGKSRNAPIAEVVEQAKKIAESGQREIVITGINTGDFGRSTGEKFIDLLRALNAVDGIERYRISSIEPNLLTDEIIEFCAASPKFLPHFHIPLQSGSDEILGLMRRRYTTTKFADRVAAVRRLMPDAFIGIDVIVGFPGESDEHFEQTYNFLSEIAPAFLHIFPFSERRGTPAVDFKGKVPPYVSTERAARLEALNRELHQAFCASAVGQRQQVLIESSIKRGAMFGYTAEYRRVSVKSDHSLINKIVDVDIIALDTTGAADLVGVVVAEKA